VTCFDDRALARRRFVIEQFNPAALAGVYVSFNASMAGFSFAGLTFLLTWTRSDALAGKSQAARQRALIALATAVLVFIIAAAQYALATANGGARTTAWIMTASTAPASILAAALLVFSIAILFRAHGLAFATSVSRRLFDFVYVMLGGYILMALLGATTQVAFDAVPMAQLPPALLVTAVLVVAVPMTTPVFASRWAPMARFVSGDRAFERLVFTMLGVVLGGLAVNAIAYATQVDSVDHAFWIGLVLVGLVGVSSTLALTRLVLTSLLDEPVAEPLEEPQGPYGVAIRDP
jgi:hypothetical protein